MASRSTRNKIRFQGKKIQTAFRKIYEHAKYMEDVAQEGSEKISRELPVLIQLTCVTEDFWNDFLDEL